MRTRPTLVLFFFVLSTLLSCSHQDPRQPSGRSYPVEVLGGDEASFTPPAGSPVANTNRYDAIIVGAGIAGLTSAVYLTEKGRKVLLLEKEKSLGGIASGGSLDSHLYDRGTAYFTDAYEEEQKILDHIGFGDFREKFAIHEPIDSYLWNGKLYLGFWEEHYRDELMKLPASFELFRKEMKILNETGQIANQPFEHFDCNDVDAEVKAARQKHSVGEIKDCYRLDSVDAATFVRNMPAQAARRRNEESKKIYDRLQKEIKSGRLKAEDPMKDVVDFLDLYCRSALGAETKRISAMAFVNFYISELETRYTTPTGTGHASTLMEKMLRKRAGLIDVLTEAAVAKIDSGKDQVAVTYVHGGKTYVARADYGVFAAQSKVAPKLIQGLSEQAPEKAKAMSGLDYSHYSVHAVKVKGHPYRATYDTWTRHHDYTDDDFTDVILGRWMDPRIHGYEGMRDFKKDPSDNDGILSIYHPLGQKHLGSGYTKEQSIAFARRATDRMLEIYSPLARELGNQTIQVESVQTSRWPFSVHVAEPGHFKKKAKLLRERFGRVFFAHSNIGTPAFEEALFRGHCAANNILLRLDRSFKQESWTKCPVER